MVWFSHLIVVRKYNFHTKKYQKYQEIKIFEIHYVLIYLIARWFSKIFISRYFWILTQSLYFSSIWLTWIKAMLLTPSDYLQCSVYITRYNASQCDLSSPVIITRYKAVPESRLSLKDMFLQFFVFFSFLYTLKSRIFEWK